MYLWQEEMLLQQRRQRNRLWCQCCEEPVETEMYLDLEPFGIHAVACQRCIAANLYSAY